ncbi:hypothetical protein HK405_012567, partial [Cladochytrium tenue]
MNGIIENDLRRIDLNLLLVLQVMLEEGSVTRTAERLYLGQPAISGSLAWLREAFSDPLFVRTPKGMRPTPHTLVKPFLRLLHEELQGPPAFDPAASERIFHLGMSDALEAADAGPAAAPAGGGAGFARGRASFGHRPRPRHAGCGPE